MTGTRLHKLLYGKNETPFEITPLIDVVFLLLVFFLVVTSFERPRAALRVRLPVASEPAGPGEPRRLRIEVTADSLAADGASLSDDALPALLAQAAAEKREVLLAADRDVPYQRVVTVLDQATRAGVEQLTLESERPAGQTSR